MNTRKIRWIAAVSVAALIAVSGCKNASEIKGRDELIVGEAVDFASYEPIGIMDGLGFSHYSEMVYETLVRFENGEVKPALAERWEHDEHSWTFHLRRGVTFTDGERFTAEAVKVNIEKMQEFVGDYLGYYGAVSRISAVEAADEYTVRFRYAEPYPAVLQELSASAFGMLSPRLFENGNNPYGSYTADTAGTGPYEIKAANCVAGQRYRFTRNPQWYGQNGGPESFTVMIIPDADSRALALKAGEIDILFGSYQITYDMLEQVRMPAQNGMANQNGAGAGLTVRFSDKTYITRNLLLNASSPLTRDKQLRLALEYAINKDEIINTVLHGSEVKADTLFTRDMPYCDVALPPYQYDKARAVSLLEQAGWTELNGKGIRMRNGTPLQLRAIYQSAKPIDGQILTAVKGQLADIGIDLVLQGYETMTWFDTGTSDAFELSVNDTYGFPQDPHVFLTAMADDGLDKTSQAGLVQKARIDACIAGMMSTVDEDAIRDDYRFILTTLHDEAVNIPISYAREMAVYNSEKVKDIAFADNPYSLDMTRVIVFSL